MRLDRLVLHRLTDNVDVCWVVEGALQATVNNRMQPHSAMQCRCTAARADDARRRVELFRAQTRRGSTGWWRRPSLALFPFQKLPESGAFCYMPHLIFPEFVELLVWQRRAGCNKCGVRQRCAGFEGLWIGSPSKHMMFSNVFQDILARWHRIQGLLALFLTGIHQARNVMVSILCSARAGCLRV